MNRNRGTEVLGLAPGSCWATSLTHVTHGAITQRTCFTTVSGPPARYRAISLASCVRHQAHLPSTDPAFILNAAGFPYLRPYGCLSNHEICVVRIRTVFSYFNTKLLKWAITERGRGS